MQTVTYSVLWSDKASRLELFVRLVYGIPFAVIMLVLFHILGLFTLILPFVAQALTILFSRARSKTIADFFHKYYLDYIFQYFAYYLLLTDERPAIVPGDAMRKVKVYYSFKPLAMRRELLVRILYAIAFHIIGTIVGVVAFVALVLQAIIVLFTGRRNRTLWEFSYMYGRFLATYVYYLGLQTDERPQVLPQ
ncbi:MAG: DUF4389 domain-containing protein [Candidatus Micrarchaeia archaeon]|jgi:hypothetical protein